MRDNDSAAMDLSVTADIDFATYPVLQTIRQCIGDVSALSVVAAAALQELLEKIDSHAFNLVIVGEFKRGKSSITNALIGANLLPVGVVPLTAIATILSYSDQLTVQVIYQSGQRESVDSSRLWEYVTEKGNPKNEKGVQEVSVGYPSTWLKNGVRLIDTPGIGSVYRHNSAVTYSFLPKADAVLFLLSVDQPIGQAESDFLKAVGEYASKIFFLLNKVDTLANDDELSESVTFSSQVITDVLKKPVRIFPLSARLALEAQTQHSDALLAQSRFPEFSAALEQFLMKEKGNVFVASVARRLVRLVSHARFTAELAQRSLNTPIEELQQKIALFESKREEVAQEKSDFVILLDGESTKLLDHVVTEDVENFERALASTIDAAIHKKFKEIQQLPSRVLYETLERYVIDETKKAYDEWREKEDEKLSAAFHALCARFTAKIDDAIDALFRFSSVLFAIPFDTVHAKSEWSMQSHFYYKFWTEPVSLQIITSSLILALPKWIGDQLILKAVRKYGNDMVEMQAGRVRYDFSQRLDKSLHAFKATLLARIDTTLASIESAVHKGAEMRADNTQVASERSRDLDATLQVMDDVACRLGKILERY